MDLPVFDDHGDCLSSLELVDEAMLDNSLGGVLVVRSLVVVASGGRVLMGFHLRRRQWELPGGALEVGESAHEAAVRELAEETGIRVGGLSLVARAEFVFTSEEHRHWAAVFNVTFDAQPMTVANEEMADFRWWTVDTDLWEGLSPLDAEVARRSLPNDLASPAIR